MKKLLLFVGFFLLCAIGFSQFKELDAPWNYKYAPQVQDTLVIDFKNGERMNVTCFWFRLFYDKEEYMLDFDRMFAELEQAVSTLNLGDGKYYLKFQFRIPPSGTSLKPVPEDIYQLTVEKRLEAGDKQVYRVESGKLAAKQKWQHLVEFDCRDRNWNVKIYVNDLHDLSALKQNYRTLFQAQHQAYQSNQLYKGERKLFYELDNNSLNYKSSLFIEKRNPFFAFHLYPMIGTSLQKGKLSTDVGIMLGASFNDHQYGNSRLGLRYQLKGFGEETPNSVKMCYNGFADATLDVNFGRNVKKQDWLGVGLGYLVNRDGDVYGKNTGRVFFNYRSSKLWGIQPEFNYSYDDRKGHIGIGLFLSL